MKFIDDSVEMDSKCSYSHGVFTLVTIIAISASAVMEVLCAILFLVNEELGLYVYQLLFYPTAIGLIITFFYSIPELLRNIYMSSLLAVILAGVLTVLLIVSIILQAVFLGKVYIIPFSIL